MDVAGDLRFMGNQINYYMKYDSFVLLAQKAIELGCEIIPFSDDVLKRGYSSDKEYSFTWYR